MTMEQAPWFVAERSETLAGLLLTSRKDVAVRSAKKKADGVEFLLAVNEGEPWLTRLFVVQVKGTTLADSNEWLKGVNESLQNGSSALYLPVCVFVVNVRDNRAFYAWVAEPLVEGQSARLHFHHAGTFFDLNQSSVHEMVDRIKAWYEVLLRQLVPK